MSYEINKQTSDTINIVKFIAIILVCYIHSYRDSINFVGSTIQLDIPIWFDIIQYSISKIVAAVAVPLFFFFSSVLIYRKNIIFKDNVRKKTRTLLIPYLILNTIGITSYFVLQQIPPLSMFFSKPEFIISNWNFYDWINAYIGYRTGYPLLFPLWFIRNLLILNIFCIPIEFLVKKYNVKFLFILCITYFFSGYISTNANWTLFITSIFYWTLGCYCSIYNIKFENIYDFVEKYHLLLFYIFGIVTCYILHHINISCPIEITTMLGVLCFISYAFRIKNTYFKNIIQKLSPYIFPIYLFHEFNLTFFRKLLAAILPNTINFIALEYILCPLIIIIYCIILAVMLNKISPKLYSIITGGRL